MTMAGLLVGTFSPVAKADDMPNTLKVTPVRSDVTVAPGQSTVVKVTVANLTSAPIAVKPIANDFIAGDESGTPSLILEADKFAPTHSLKRFMAPLPDAVIPANQGKTFEVGITVPADAQAGGYFGAIRFAPSSPDGGGQVNMSASVASLILLTVPGDIVEQLSLTDFEIKQGDKVGSFFQTPNDLHVSTRFTNDGNVQLGPWGKVSVKQGDKVVYSYDFNVKDPRDMVLPDSARRWEVDLKNIESFGHYTVSATFTYGQKNQTIEVSRSFWVVPMAVIIGTVVGLLVLIALIVGVWLFLKSYKRRILSSQGGGYRR